MNPPEWSYRPNCTNPSKSIKFQYQMLTLEAIQHRFVICTDERSRLVRGVL